MVAGYSAGSNLSSIQYCETPGQVHKGVLLAPQRWQGAPQDGVVAVKVQYPDALQTMLQDLGNIRVAAGFLQASACHDPQNESPSSETGRNFVSCSRLGGQHLSGSPVAPHRRRSSVAEGTLDASKLVLAPLSKIVNSGHATSVCFGEWSCLGLSPAPVTAEH